LHEVEKFFCSFSVFSEVYVFFVISGYLIVSLILKELRGDRFSLIKFWERRARRIIPALAVVVLASLFAGWFLLLPLHYGDLGKSAAFLSVFCANFYFWLGTGYFAGVSEEKPLLHTWSLAVEDQFYFFIPLVLMGLFHFVALRKRGALLSVFGAGFLLSFGLSLLIVPSHPAAGFFLLPTRAWELLLGSVLAIIPTSYVSSSRFVRETLSWSGVCKRRLKSAAGGARKVRHLPPEGNGFSPSRSSPGSSPRGRTSRRASGEPPARARLRSKVRWTHFRFSRPLASCSR